MHSTTHYVIHPTITVTHIVMHYRPPLIAGRVSNTRRHGGRVHRVRAGNPNVRMWPQRSPGCGPTNRASRAGQTALAAPKPCEHYLQHYNPYE